MLALLAQPGLIVGRAPAPSMTAATASQLEANRLASSTASYLDSTITTSTDGVVTPTELSGAELPLADGTVTAGSWIESRQAALKAAALKNEGAAAIEQRTTTQQGLKVAMLKTEGQNVINMREVRQAQLEEQAAAADLGDAPDGFVWGGVY